MEKEKTSTIKTIGNVLFWTVIVGGVLFGIHALAHAFAVVRWGLFYLIDGGVGCALKDVKCGCTPLLLLLPFEYVLVGFLWGFGETNARLAEHPVAYGLGLVVIVALAVYSDYKSLTEGEDKPQDE